MRRRFAALSLGLVLLICGLSVPTTASAQPNDFRPSSTSWLDPDHGWVLGYRQCGPDQCPVLLVTWDGGRTWVPSRTPDVPLPENNKRVRVWFGTVLDGLITDGTRLFATHTGGLFWHQVNLPDTNSTVAVGQLAAGAESFFAVITTDSTTRVYSSRLRSDRWRPVPGVSVAGRADGDIVAHGKTAYVALTAVHVTHGYWTTQDTRTWHHADPPCSVDANVDLGLPPGKDHPLYALCSSNPGMGYMYKELVKATDSTHFTSVSTAPAAGITVGFAAASPSTVAVSAVGPAAARIYTSTQHATSWQTTLTMNGFPLFDLAFTDALHGIAVWGGPQWP